MGGGSHADVPDRSVKYTDTTCPDIQRELNIKIQITIAFDLDVLFEYYFGVVLCNGAMLSTLALGASQGDFAYVWYHRYF